MPKNNAKIIISAEDKTKQAFDSISTRLGSIATISGAAVLAAGAGLVAFAKQTADFNDQMIKTAQAVGTSSEELSALTYAASLGGVEFEELSKGMGRLAKTTEDYRDGLKTAVDAFDKLQLDPTQFNDTSELFEAVAEELSKLPDGAQKSAIAMSLLGRSGAKLIPVMNGGAAAIKAAKDEAAQFGLVVDTDIAQASEQLNDNFTRLQAAGKGLGIELANRVIPGLADTTDEIVAAVKEGRELEALLLAIGGIGRIPIDIVFNVEPLTVTPDNTIQELETEVKEMEADLLKLRQRGGGFLNELILGGSEDELQRELDIKRSQLEGFVKFRDQLITSEGKGKPATSSSEESASPVRLPGISKQAKDLEKLKAQLEKAIAPTRSQAEALQLQLDAFRSLQPEVRGYLQGLVDQVEAQEQATKAAKEWQELADLQRASDDEALRQLEDLSAAEIERQEAMQAQAKTIKELYDPTLKLLDLQFEYQQLLSEGLITQEEYDFALQKSKEAMEDMSKDGQDYFKELKREIAGFSRDAASELVDFASTGEESFGDMVESMLRNFARLAVKTNITDPLFESLGGIFEGSDGGGFGNFFGSLFGGFRAAGGPVMSNKAYVVGENGPELLTGATGRIIPNHALGGSSNVVVNIVGAPQTPTVQQNTNADGTLSVDIIFDMVKNHMIKDVRGEGDFAQVLEDQYSLNRAGGGY